MTITNPFQWHLDTNGYAIIDGALATELQNRGCDLNDPLWSAKVLMEQPQLIEDVHYDYFLAGADCAITASYQATPLGLASKGCTLSESIDLIKKSVQLAQQAKERYLLNNPCNKELVIAGSVGPYGAFLADGSEYTGDYSLSDEEIATFHHDRIQALIEAGIDIIAFETMPSFPEIKVLANLIKQYNKPCWFTFTLKDHDHISDGTPLATVINWLNSIEHVMMIGVNCIALDSVTAALKTLSQYTNKPLIVYPNSGEHYDPNNKTWCIATHRTLCEYADEWQQYGAQLIGGCCRTTPDDIKQLVNQLHEKKHP